MKDVPFDIISVRFCHFVGSLTRDFGPAQIAVGVQIGQQQRQVDESIVVGFEEVPDAGAALSDHPQSEQRLQRHVVVVVDEICLDDVIIFGVFPTHGGVVRLTQADHERQTNVADCHVITRR